MDKNLVQILLIIEFLENSPPEPFNFKKVLEVAELFVTFHPSLFSRRDIISPRVENIEGDLLFIRLEEILKNEVYKRCFDEMKMKRRKFNRNGTAMNLPIW
ncbi:MAG: hypothetical protein ACOYL6_17580 [Bacteriovoracaceae bacterium]